MHAHTQLLPQWEIRDSLFNFERPWSENVDLVYPRIPCSSVEGVSGSFLALQNQEIKANLQYISGYIRDTVLMLSDGILSLGLVEASGLLRW